VTVPAGTEDHPGGTATSEQLVTGVDDRDPAPASGPTGTSVTISVRTHRASGVNGTAATFTVT
jgi:hypothetical protein